MSHTDTISTDRPQSQLTEVVNGRVFEITVFDGGRGGFEAVETKEDRKGNSYEVRHLLPPIIARIQNAGGIDFVIPEQGGAEVMVVSAKEIDNSEAIIRRGVAREIEAMQDRALRNLWRRLAEQLTEIQKPSPSIYEGEPFLTSKTVGTDLDGSEEKAKATAAELGRRLQPLGRWVVGAILFSPWIKKVGAENTVIHLVGGAGEGKSLLTRVGAWLFGVADSDKGLWTAFNASGQGLQALSQGLSWYPLLLDETQNTTAEISKTLTDLVMGATRQRANRNGSAQGARGSWEGLIVATGNDPLNLQHEMFSRRFIGLQAADLWERPSEGTRTWWAETAQLLSEDYGFAWDSVRDRYTPGTDAAKKLPLDLARLMDKLPDLEDGDSLLTVALLGLYGAMWLARWSGEKAWADGVWAEISETVKERQAEKRDLKEEVALRIATSQEEDPIAWVAVAGDPRSATKGWPSSDGALLPCGVAHSEECLWVNMSSLAFGTLTKDLDQARLFGDPDWVKALAPGTDRKKPRRVRGPHGGQKTVLTFCESALLAFRERTVSPDREEPKEAQTAGSDLLEVIPAPTTQQAPAGADPEEDGTMANDFRTVRTPGLLEERDTNGRLQRNLEGMNSTLNAALARGIANLLIPADWSPLDLEDWEPRGTGMSTSFTVHRRDEEATEIRLWRIPSNADPQSYRAALLRMLEEDPKYTTGGGLAIFYLKAPNRGKAPRWVLNGEAADALADRSGFFNSVIWGVPSREREGLELTQYDRNRSHLPAIAGAIVAPLWHGEEYKHHGEDAPISPKLAGLYSVRVPEWPLELPSPYGNAQPGEVKWVESVVLRFHRELMETYTEIEAPEILEAWLAPAHKTAALQGLAEKTKDLLERFSDNPEALGIAKEVYKSAAGAIGSPTAYKKVQRPDWEAAIKLTSWVNVLRAVYRAHQDDERFVPVALNVDAIYYPKGLPTPPGLRIGTGLGEYKEVEA